MRVAPYSILIPASEITLPQRGISYSSLASCTVHAVVDEVLAASGGAAGRPFVIVLICADDDKRFSLNPIVVIGRSANFLEGGAVHTYAGRMSERMPAIKVVMMPKDTNAHGTIFGGVILSNIDLASGVEAFKVANMGALLTSSVFIVLAVVQTSVPSGATYIV